MKFSLPPTTPTSPILPVCCHCCWATPSAQGELIFPSRENDSDVWSNTFPGSLAFIHSGGDRGRTTDLLYPGRCKGHCAGRTDRSSTRGGANAIQHTQRGRVRKPFPENSSRREEGEGADEEDEGEGSDRRRRVFGQMFEIATTKRSAGSWK